MGKTAARNSKQYDYSGQNKNLEEDEEARLASDTLNCMIVFADNMDDDYVSNYYGMSEQILNLGGLTFLHKELFEWAEQLLRRIHSRLSPTIIESNGKKAVQTAYRILQNDRFLSKKFLESVRKIDGIPGPSFHQ